VPVGVAIPPSLKNIYKELEKDIPGFTIPTHGCLENWAKQGVLLLNATLTVRLVSSGISKHIYLCTYTQNIAAKHQDKNSWQILAMVVFIGVYGFKPPEINSLL